ncbi:MAG: serine/threonine protein kinase [Nitrososphaerales archaeon]
MIAAISKLDAKTHGQVLCYPGTNLKSFASRIKQLRKLGVLELIFDGSSKIGSYGVIGKGCVSIVLKARIEGYDEIVAIKCRRVDANRQNMKQDYELQKFANSFGVGPKAISCTNDFFVMEYVDSIKIGKWFQSLKTRSSKKFLRNLVRDCLTQCYLLDVNGLDHGELSNPTKHILLKKDLSGSIVPKVTIIDYESAGTERKVSNLTSVAQFFFLGGWQSIKVRKILSIPKGNKKLISLLREYKEDPSKDSFDKLMKYVKC